MPGVESENIDVEVLGNTVTLRAGLRGPAQAERRYLIHEWTYGLYERRVELPIEVDAAAANASHDNGVLVLSLPKARGPRAVKIQLNHAGSGEARHRGHSGHGVASEGIEE
jgi:HSP20 family protein